MAVCVCVLSRGVVCFVQNLTVKPAWPGALYPDWPLNLAILLPLLPEYWNYRYGPSLLAFSTNIRLKVILTASQVLLLVMGMNLHTPTDLKISS